MIQDRKSQLSIFVAKFGHYPIVLGMHWLRLHDVAVRFASITVTFGSQYCTTRCHDGLIAVQGVAEEPAEPDHSQGRGIFQPQIRPQRPFR